MTNNKQSSVEWLVVQLWEQMNMQGDGAVVNEIFEQAKAMHKEEIIHAYNQSWHFRDKPYETGEKHYAETFGDD